jgi:DNA uptake protein ComE-like DNA-binding protein
MDSSRSQSDDWLVKHKAPAGEAQPAGESRTGSLSQRLDEDERALADLGVRLDALESGLRIEIREWLTEELNRIAARLEISEPEAIALAPSPAAEFSAREREVLDESDFLPYAERVEAQLREVEARVERAGRVVRDLSASEPPIRPTPPEPTPDDPGREAEESSVDVINRISFEQLRDFGLSVTQAARLLARRDARGSFASLDDLNDLAGFSRDVLEQLRKRLSLS